MPDNIITEFPVTVYGNLEKYSETISKGRCRVFYRGQNRNGTYITNEFAEKLLSSIPYTPVKGIYEGEDADYTDHGEKRSEGRIYGIVPERPNLTWEKHLDEDGIEREYACVDVLIYTALYKEASRIFGKAQSMEIYPPSIKGDWQVKNGKRVFVYTEGSFLGLQVLGDEVEPCFEGAAFFAFYNDLKKVIAQLDQYNLNLHNGGKQKMLNYKLSDNAKFMALWSLLNVNYSEANGWLIEYDICEIYDQYAVVKNYVEGTFERVYYTKDDETDSLIITERTRCFIVDINEDEKKALDALQSLNGGNFEKVDENYSAQAEKISDLTTTNSNFELKIEELQSSVSTLTTERDEASAQLETANTQLDEANTQLEEAQTTMATLQEEIGRLNSFKADVEKREKEEVLSKYEDVLDADVIGSFSEKLDTYSATELDKELAYALVKSNQSVFSKNPQTGFIPKDEGPVGGLEELLSKYKRD